MLLPASYLNGFAPRDGQPLYPSLSKGCVGAWNPGLGPTGLTLRDQSGFKNNGTLTLRTAASAWGPNQGRYSLLFSGSSVSEATSTQGRIVVAKELAAVKNGFSCWLRPSSLTKRGICTSGPNQGSPSFAITFLANGTLEVYRGANTVSTAVVMNNTWSHVFIWNDSVNTSYWINGFFSNTAVQGSSPSLQTEFVIGANYWGAFDGYIDDVRMYSQLPSPQEIRTLATRRGIAYEMAPRRRSSSAVATTNRRRRIIIGGNR